TVLEQREESLRNRRLLEIARGTAADDHVPDLVRQDQQLEDRRPAEEAAAEAGVAPLPLRGAVAAELLEEGEILLRPAADPGRALIERNQFLAPRANRPGEALSEHGIERARHQVRLHAQVQQS